MGRVCQVSTRCCRWQTAGFGPPSFRGGPHRLLGCLQLPIAGVSTGDRQHHRPDSPGAPAGLGNPLATRLKVAHRSGDSVRPARVHFTGRGAPCSCNERRAQPHRPRTAPGGPEAQVVFAALVISRQAALRRCLRCRTSILEFECFEPGKIGAGGGFEFTGSYGAYDPSFVAGPEHEDGHPTHAGPHHASYCAIFVTWTAAAVPGPDDGSRRDQVACVKHTVYLLLAGGTYCTAAMFVIVLYAITNHACCFAAFQADSD